MKPSRLLVQKRARSSWVRRFIRHQGIKVVHKSSIAAASLCARTLPTQCATGLAGRLNWVDVDA